jgi:hypothetical protein
MANDIPCGKCMHYHELKKITDEEGGTVSLHMGHCLQNTIYAANKPGNHVHPPGARVEDLPFGRHLITVVEEKELRKFCETAKAR